VIVLDTNVVSEGVKPAPLATVMTWLDAQDTATLYLTTVTLAEVYYGIRALPDGRRRRALADGFQRVLTEGFEGRILTFDERAAVAYGDLMTHRRQLGRPMSILDGQIAAIARARGFAVATRNERDFEDCGIALVNPFR